MNHPAFKNKNKQDLPTINRASDILGTHTSKEFELLYQNDFKNAGFTTPGLKYQGPGNSTNLGEPINSADALAQKHDLQYNHTSYKYHKGLITLQQYDRRIQKIDKEYIKNNAALATVSFNPLEQIPAVIGTLGIGAKHLFEKAAGQKYPVTNKKELSELFKLDNEPQKTDLTDTLYKNLKKNSTNYKANQATPMGQPEEKKQKLDNDFSSFDLTASQSSGVPSQPTNLPETPRASQDVEMNLTGTGKGQASGGASSDGQMAHYIDRPMSMFGTKENTYIKCHKFMTFGIAPTFLRPAAPATDTFSIWLTSYLAEIPWHIPAFYLNQSEFDLLPPGTRVKNVSIEVVYRGSTIQFETNATKTSLATLNQINDIATAKGLNLTGWGSNARYTSFNNDQPMLPTGVRKPTYAPTSGIYRGMVRDYYGSNNTDTNYINDVPKHQIGRQSFLYNYWCNSGRNNSVLNNQQFGGWPCLSQKINQMDGKTVINQVVLSESYSPKMAPIKVPLKMQGHGLPFPGGANAAASVVRIPGIGHFVNKNQCNLTVPVGIPTSGGVQLSGVEEQYSMTNFNNVAPTLTIYSPIEKSQISQQGLYGDLQSQAQPSLHVGVQPVPSLTTTSTITEDSNFNQWTDTRAYWEITAKMVVEEHQPTEWPFAIDANVAMGANVLWAPNANRPVAIIDPAEDGATMMGLYTNTAANL